MTGVTQGEMCLYDACLDLSLCILVSGSMKSVCVCVCVCVCWGCLSLGVSGCVIIALTSMASQFVPL